MIADALATLADGVSLNTGAPGSYIIGDVIDLQRTARGIGVLPGLSQVWLVATVDTTATSGGGATLQLNLVTDDNSAMPSPTVVASSAAIAVAQLTAGKLIVAVAMPLSDTLERYLGLQQVTGTAAFTAGKVNAFFTTTPPGRYAYPDGI